jgi:Zn-dependent protease
MFPTFRLGRILGFSIDLSASFLLLLAVVFFMTGGLSGVVVVLLAFASVLVHELGHALVARRLDVRVDSIELYFFGGAAKMVEAPRTAEHEIAIAAAGPAVSFAIGGLAMLLHGLTGVALLATLAWVNLILGAFNLLPALPMDGGRILRAALARRMPFARATHHAVRVARWIAAGLAVAGLFQGSLYMVLVAGLVWMLGSRERAMVERGLGGYRDTAGVEVLPRGFSAAPRWSGGGGFAVRRHGGRLVIEPLD